MTKEVRLYYLITCGHYFLKVCLSVTFPGISLKYLHIYTSHFMCLERHIPISISALKKNLRWLKSIIAIGAGSFPGGPVAKNPPAHAEDWGARSLGWEDPLEQEMASHSSILAWEIPWTEEPEGLQSIVLQRVRHDWATEHAPRSEKNMPNISKHARVHIQRLSYVRLFAIPWNAARQENQTNWKWQTGIKNSI